LFSQLNTIPRLWVEVNLDNIIYNFKILKNYIDDPVRFMAVVKGNAYGHGAEIIADTLQKYGIWGFGVAYIEEALKLRETGIKLPILIMGSSLGEDAKYVIQYNLSQTVSTFKHAFLLSKAAKKESKNAKIHLKIDTGLHRLGVDWNKAFKVAQSIVELPNIRLEGIYTHFSQVDENSSLLVEEQLHRLLNVSNKLSNIEAEMPLRHAAATAALLLYPNTYLDMVRVGSGIYGLNPVNSLRGKIKLKETFTLKTHIIHLKNVPSGHNIGYGSTFETKRNTKVATIPVGFYDAGSLLSAFRRALVKSKKVQIIGTVSQNFCMIDVTEVEGVQAGDEVVLLGTQGNQRIDIHEVINEMGVLMGEVYSMIKADVPRFYISNDKNISNH
jgi:alanine racemase